MNIKEIRRIIEKAINCFLKEQKFLTPGSPEADKFEKETFSRLRGVNPFKNFVFSGGGGSSEESTPESQKADGPGSVPGDQKVYTPAEMRELAREAGFTYNEAIIMGAIGKAESGGNPLAHNPCPGRGCSTGDDSHGLWQINMINKLGPYRRKLYGIKDDKELFDPRTNARAAYGVFKREKQGFGAWSVYKNGRYLKYLNAAKEPLGVT
jgi:hypothetical protein